MVLLSPRLDSLRYKDFPMNAAVVFQAMEVYHDDDIKFILLVLLQCWSSKYGSSLADCLRLFWSSCCTCLYLCILLSLSTVAKIQGGWVVGTAIYRVRVKSISLKHLSNEFSFFFQ